LVLWKIINEEDVVLIPKNQGDKFSSGFLHSEFLRQAELLCRRYINCCFISGHSDITRFRPWSPVATGNHLDRAKRKNSKFAQTTGTVYVLIHVQAFQNSLLRKLPHVQIFMNDGPNPLTWDAQLFSKWFSRNPAGGLPRLYREFDQ
jgi:hypothetical protein